MPAKVEKAAIQNTAMGWLLVVSTARGIRRVALADTKPEVVEILKSGYPECTLVLPEDMPPFALKVSEWLEDSTTSLALPLDIQGTDFQKAVWRQLQSIPWGKTKTYSEVARLCGRPSAVRAVASACGANPVALIIPCHRVVGSNGKLCGFRWGLKRKEWLLKREIP